MNEQEQWEYVRTWLRQNGVWLLAGRSEEHTSELQSL